MLCATPTKNQGHSSDDLDFFYCELGMRFHLAVKVRYRLGGRNCYGRESGGCANGRRGVSSKGA